MAQAIQLIVGLGNPGNEYDQTRHNAGFWFVDELARRYNGTWKNESRFKAEACAVMIAGHKVWLSKPTTFMNRSGEAAQALAHFYKIPVESMLVAHDEIDLPPGTTRLKKAGGHGGHNGLRDLIAHMDKDFWRLRIGVGHPGSKAAVVNYVLGRPSVDDRVAIDRDVDRAADVVEDLVSGRMESAMQTLHSAA